ncbi:MAG TPA: hypothetical protein VMU30_11335 [Bacteroidota bacterium]|nr:hypothetical protein [Bacteroidota bacterium]
MNIPHKLPKNLLLLFFFAVVAVIGSVWILRSNGFYYIDECAHYLYCRFVLQALPTTVQMWHRPLPQWLFALPAQLGHTFTMFFALALFLVLLWMAWRIAVSHRIKHAEWVVLLVGLQPTLFDVSYACMTEVPAAFMITLSYLYHRKEKHGWALSFASAVFLCRTEMYLFAGIMFLVYLWKREWKILPLVLLGPMLWIGSTTIISGNIMTFFREWKTFAQIGKFIPGIPVTHYFTHLYAIFGAAQVLLFAAGAVFIAKAKRSAEFGIIYGTIFATLILHTLAGAEIFHFTASIGELRYIAVVGPLFGIVSVYGLSEFLDRLKSPRRQLMVSLVVMSVVVFHCTLATHPRRWENYEKIVVDLTHGIQTEFPHLILLTNHCAAAYAMDVVPSGNTCIASLNVHTLALYPESIILWDPFSSNSIFFQTALTKDMLLQDSTVHLVQRYVYRHSEYLVLHKKSVAPIHH